MDAAKVYPEPHDRQQVQQPAQEQQQQQQMTMMMSATPPPPYQQGAYFVGGYHQAVTGQGALRVGTPPPTYLGWSITNLVLCCFPLGIAAIIYSSSAMEHLSTGNYEEASKRGRLARTLNVVGFVLGALMWVVLIAFVIIVFGILANVQLPDYRTAA